MFKKKKKRLDAQAVPIEDRIDSLEKTAKHNAESKDAIFNAIQLELKKIKNCAETSSKKRK